MRTIKTRAKNRGEPDAENDTKTALNGKGRQRESGAERYEEEDMEKQNKKSMQGGRHLPTVL